MDPHQDRNGGQRYGQGQPVGLGSGGLREIRNRIHVLQHTQRYRGVPELNSRHIRRAILLEGRAERLEAE